MSDATHDAILATLAKTAERDDRQRVVICFGGYVTLYFRNGSDSQMRQAVLECVEEYDRMFGSHLNWWVTEGRRPSRVASLVSRSMEKYLLSDRYAAPDSDLNWAFRWHGGEQPDDASPFRIEGFGASAADSVALNALSYLTCVVPVPLTPESVQRLYAIARRWSERLAPVHGYGGVAVIESPDSTVAGRSEGRVTYFLRRHKGLDSDHPLQHALFLKEGIKTGGWVTVLGPEMAARLGGLEKFEEALAGAFDVERLSNGCILVTLKAPEVGDTYYSLDTPELQRLNRFLAPIRVELHPSVRRSPNGLDRASYEAWLRRFD